MKIIGFDVGSKRIGVAKADSATRIAVPIEFIEVDGSEWEEIVRIARINSTNLFVVGLPRSNEGNETKQSLYSRQFAKKLREKIPDAKIRFQDESFTSVVAEERLKKRKKRYTKGDIDAEAASIILQDYLESLAEKIRRPTKESHDSKKNSKTQSDKILLNAKKVKHKMKTSTKWIIGISVLLIVGLVGTGVALLIKEKRHQEYLDWLAEQAAQMEPEVFSFMIRPGETIYEVKKSLMDVGYPETEVDAALGKNYDFDFLKGRPEGATLEGYLFGETHEFYKSASVEEVIETFLRGMGDVIKDNDLEKKYADQGLSLYEGITLASIVQKEAPSPEQPTVAQVFLSRLSAGVPLGSDVTVSYALDTIDPDRVIYQDNQSALTVDSCYNTRVHNGLPCGPISNPGISALLAVANPSDSSYFYFLTGDDGLMYYSYTESEHIQNIHSHCKELCDTSL